MSMIWMDSFDRYTTNAQVAERYDNVITGAAAASIVAAAGRNGSACLRLSHVGGTFGGSAARVEVAVNNLATVTQTFAYKAHDIAADCVIAYLIDNATEQMRLVLRADKKLEVRRGATVLATGTKVISQTAYNHIAWKVTIHNTTGAVEVRVENVVDINISAQNTRVSANNYCTKVGLGDNAVINVGLSVTKTEDFDDYYINDTAGAVNTGFSGDLRIEAVSPDGNGYQNDFTPSAGSAFQCVDEATPNGDTDYAESGTVGHIQAYTMGPIGAAVTTVQAVAVNSYCKKDDAGTKTVRHGVRHSGANTTGPDWAPSTSYDFRQTIIEGVIASASDANAMEVLSEIRS